MKRVTAKFIPIVWTKERNGRYVDIDCYRLDNKEKVSFFPQCCPESTTGCTLAACECVPYLGMHVSVFDKGGNKIAHQDFERAECEEIIIDEDELGNILIKKN